MIHSGGQPPTPVVKNLQCQNHVHFVWENTCLSSSVHLHPFGPPFSPHKLSLLLHMSIDCVNDFQKLKKSFFLVDVYTLECSSLQSPKKNLKNPNKSELLVSSCISNGLGVSFRAPKWASNGLIGTGNAV